MSNLDGVIGGRLKLKGVNPLAVAALLNKKNKKSKQESNKRKSVDDDNVDEQSKQIKNDSIDPNTSSSKMGIASDQANTNNIASLPPTDAIRKTKAELKYEEYRKKHIIPREVSTMAGKSYRERVQEFNKYVESLSEHHDIPRVGPG